MKIIKTTNKFEKATTDLLIKEAVSVLITR